MPASIFIDDNDENSVITVIVFIANGKKGFVYCDIDHSKLLKMAGDDVTESDIEQHQVLFKQPSYGDTSRIFSSGIRMGADEEINISPSQIRQERLCVLLKSWTFKNSAGKDMAATKDNVKKLHPAIAMILGIALEKELSERGLL